MENRFGIAEVDKLPAQVAAQMRSKISTTGGKISTAMLFASRFHSTWSRAFTPTWKECCLFLDRTDGSTDPMTTSGRVEAFLCFHKFFSLGYLFRCDYNLDKREIVWRVPFEMVRSRFLFEGKHKEVMDEGKTIAVC